MDQSRTLQDAKEFLRATLISKSHGVQQSKLEKEYEELTVGEKIPWLKLGFSNLFEFLMSVPDVAKLEWREEDQDNRVFAVLDKETFTSLHAKKMSEKGFGRGSKALSPEEIKEWKQANGISILKSDASKDGKKKQNKKKQRKNRANYMKKSPKPNGSTDIGAGSLSSDSSVSDHVPKSKSTSDMYKPSVLSRKENEEPNIESNIPEKYKGVLPNAKGLYSICVKLKIVDHRQFSKEKALNFVRQLFELPACKVIESNAISHTLVFVRYKTLKELVIAIEALHNHQIDGMIIDASPAKEKITKRTPANANNLFNGYEIVNSIPESSPKVPQQQPFLIASQKPGLLPTPSFSVFTGNGSMALIPPATAVYKMAFQHEVSDTKEQLPATSIQENCIADKNKKPNVEADTCSGFIITENQFFEMCLTGSKQKPKVANDLPDKVKFIVTHAEDPCQFWIHLLEQNVTMTKLTEKLQAEISNSQLNKAPAFCPSVHQFGAAKYRVDGLWYRCWVLYCNTEGKEICVFFCDYGNYETVPIEHFRLIDVSLWSLLPQAIPVQLHGVKLGSGSRKEQRKEGAEKLSSLCIGKTLEADVVKEARNSKSHIIELKNIVVPDCNGVFLEDIMIKLGLLERENDTGGPYSVNGVSKHVSGHETKRTAFSGSSFLSEAYRPQSASSISSESTFSDDSYSSQGVKFKPDRLWTASSTSEEKTMQGKDDMSFDRRTSNSPFNVGGDISQTCGQNNWHLKNEKLQSSVAESVDNISFRYEKIPVRKLDNNGLEISNTPYEINHTVSDSENTGYRTRRFRPHTPPLPDHPNLNISNGMNGDSHNPGPAEALISSVRTFQKGHVITDLVTFNQEGILNRELIELEMKRWEAEKERLQKYIKNLKEAIGSSLDAYGIILGRNRKKRLELHVKIIAAEKQLEEVNNELHDLDMSWF